MGLGGSGFLCFHLLSARRVVKQIEAGDLAWNRVPYSCGSAPDWWIDHVTGFAIKPSHPGDRAPQPSG